MTRIPRRHLALVLGLAASLLTACPSGKPSAENKNPYRNVTPDKVKNEVERVQQKEEQRNDKRLEEAR